MTDPIAKALDAFVPTFESVDGDWDAVVTTASAADDVHVAPGPGSQFARPLWLGRGWPKRLVVVAVAAVALAGAGVGIAAGFGAFDTGWNTRCPQMPAEAVVPPALRTQVHKSFPWIPLKDAGAIHVGPVWVFALSTHTSISRDGSTLDGQRRYLHRTLVAVAPAYSGRVAITGSRLGADGPRTKLGFTRGTTTCRIIGKTWCARSPLNEKPSLIVPAGKGWRTVRTEIVIGRTGCFALSATGPGLKASLPLAVPGPDWGTPGW